MNSFRNALFLAAGLSASDAFMLAAAPSRFTTNLEAYDLGLGKNSPLYGAAPSPSSIDTATKFLVDYESTRPFPSPLDETPAPKAKKRFQPVIPIRISGDDVLTIRGQQAFAQTKEREGNTAWVEMLIHEQRLQHASLN